MPLPAAFTILCRIPSISGLPSIPLSLIPITILALKQAGQLPLRRSKKPPWNNRDRRGFFPLPVGQGKDLFKRKQQRLFPI